MQPLFGKGKTYILCICVNFIRITITKFTIDTTKVSEGMCHWECLTFCEFQKMPDDLLCYDRRE